MGIRKLETIVLKSMQIVQSQSYRQLSSGGEVIAFPSPTYDAMYGAILGNATARPMIIKKRDEAFRNGINIEPNFLSKCMLCDTEYDHVVEECDECGARTRKPNVKDREILKELIELKNANSQTLEDVLKEVSIDHDIVDDGWVVSRNIYQELNGEIIDFETVEFWRIHPGNAAFSMSDAGRIGEYEYTCIFHRDFFSNDEFGNCTKCNRILQKVVAVRFREQHIEMRYIKEEIFHGSEYNPTAIYGFPPALTLWYNLILTSAQEKFMADYYVEKKWPTAAIFVPTRKRETAEFFRDTLDEVTNKDVQARPVFRFDPDAKHKPEVIRLTDTPEEMNFIPVRDESRHRFAAFWGISLVFVADVQASGGLNNESQQIAVMGWATENKQKALTRNYLDPIVANAKVEDYHFEFAQLEEEDKAAEVQLDILQGQYAQIMSGLNFEVDLDDDGKPTKFSKMEASSDPFAKMMGSGLPNTPDGSPFSQTNIGQNLGGQDSVLQQGGSKSGDMLEFLSKLPKKLINAYNDCKDMEKREEFLSFVTSDEYKGMTPDEVIEKIGFKTVLHDSQYRSGNEGVPTNQDEIKIIPVDYYGFNYEYGDWEWKGDYDFLKFEDKVIDDLSIHPDYMINEVDVENGSPRVRQGTLDYYDHMTVEMGPLVVDTNYNLLDGHHRLYALMDKNQENIRVAIVEQKENAISTKSHISLKKWTKESFERAEKQQVVKRGEDGRFSSTKESKVQPLITEEIEEAKKKDENEEAKKAYENNKKITVLKEELAHNMSLLTHEETYGLESAKMVEARQKVKDVTNEINDINNDIDDFIKNSPEGKSIRNLQDKIETHQSKLGNFESEKEKLDTEYKSAVKLINLLMYDDPQRNEVYKSIDVMNKSNAKLTKQIKHQQRQIGKKQAEIDGELRGLAHPEQGIADEIYEIDKKLSKFVKIYDIDESSLKATINKIEKHRQSLEYDKKKNIEKPKSRDWSIRWHEKEIKGYEKTIPDLEEKAELSKKILDEARAKTNYKSLAESTTLRKNEFWGYIDETTYEGRNPKYDKTEFTRGEARQLFRDEMKYAIKRLGIDLNKHPELMEIKLSISTDGNPKSWLGYSQSYDQHININPLYYIKGEKNRTVKDGLQQTIRHEIGHHLADWNLARDFFKARKYMIEWDKRSRKGEFDKMTKEELEKSQNEYRKHSTITHQFRTLKDKTASTGKGQWTQGHGKNWQDTMTVLFGTPPLSKYDGGNPFRDEVEI